MSNSQPHLGRGARFAIGAVSALLASTALLVWRPMDDLVGLKPEPDQVDITWAMMACSLLLLIPWLLRLAHWGKAKREQPLSAKLKAHIVDHNRSTPGTWSPLHPFAVHICVAGADDRIWYQRVMWEPWLVSWGKGARQGHVRRVGLIRRLYVIEVPGKGTLWPVTGAIPREPLLGEIEPMPRSFPRHRHLSSMIAAAIGIAVFAVFGFAFSASLWGAPYGIALLIAMWCWAGSAPPGLRAPKPRRS